MFNAIHCRVSRPAIHPISVQPVPTKGRTGTADLTNKKTMPTSATKKQKLIKGCSPEALDQQINPTTKNTSARSRKEERTNDMLRY